MDGMKEALDQSVAESEGKKTVTKKSKKEKKQAVEIDVSDGDTEEESDLEEGDEVVEEDDEEEADQEEGNGETGDSSMKGASTKDILGEMADLANAIDSFIHAEGDDKPTPDDIAEMLKSYTAFRKKMDVLFSEYKTKSPRKSGGGGTRKSGGGHARAASAAGGGEDGEALAGESSDQRLNREANDEVRYLGFTHIKIPIRQQVITFMHE